MSKHSPEPCAPGHGGDLLHVFCTPELDEGQTNWMIKSLREERAMTNLKGLCSATTMTITKRKGVIRACSVPVRSPIAIRACDRSL